MSSAQPQARFGDLVASDLVEVTDDLRAIEAGGRWAVAMGFEGRTVLANFRSWQRARPAPADWQPITGGWASSLTRSAYLSAVARIQQEIGRGWVYQVNLCRVLSAPCDAGGLEGLYDRLTVMGADFAGLLSLPEQGVHIASASPERFLSRNGQRITSSPIKGTAARADGFLPKDRAENIMIVDLVRNDLGRVARVGSVTVDELLAVQPYPGLFHLVSTVGALVPAVSWSQIFNATFPPGSVTGAPKSSALQVIAQVEPCPRDWYCGAFGWIDVDAQRAELAVGIRTFWLDAGRLKFGTGAGITWGSDPAGEWEETELKARRLIAIAAADSMAK
ncbi:MAG: chorismate-binding protein [Candidatus Nanopelagicales bacterium]